jgi:Flp pilus assembly protein TadG
MIAIRRTERAPSRRKRSRRRGQALIEFALLFPAVMLLLAGVADVGLLLDAHIAGIFAARQGARTGSVLGTVPQADCAIVGAVHSVLVNQPSLAVNEITIYKAAASGQSSGTAQYYIGTADCINGQIVDSTNCNLTAVPPNCPPIPALPGSNWPPSARIVTPYCEDSIGVKIDYSFTFQFGLLGSGPFPVADYAVFPMNPAPTAPGPAC